MASGLSIVGRQTLVIASTVSIKQWAVRITNRPLPPIERLGYIYVYVFFAPAPQSHWIIDEAYLRAPGVWGTLKIPQFDSNYWYKVEATWEASNIPWDAQLL